MLRHLNLHLIEKLTVCKTEISIKTYSTLAYNFTIVGFLYFHIMLLELSDKLCTSSVRKY